MNPPMLAGFQAHPRRLGRVSGWCAAGLVLSTGSSATAVAADVHDLPAGAPRFEFVLGPRELRDPKVMDITRDRLGFMWFATYTGPVRYDGTEVRWFEHDPQDASSLSDNRIRGLLPDSEGGLWVSTWDVGLNRYDPGTGRFTRYQHDPRNAESLDDNRVRALYEDRQGYLWVGTMSGLNRLDPRTGHVARYPQLTSVRPADLHPDGRGSQGAPDAGVGLESTADLVRYAIKQHVVPSGD